MSGSGGGNYVPSVRTGFDCDSGIGRTSLSSLNLDIVSDCDVGGILDVVLNNSAVVVENGNGEVLGSVLHQFSSDLADCILSGLNYKAKILSKTATSCTVKIFKI